MQKTLILTIAGLMAVSFAGPANALLPCNGNVYEIELGPETLYVDDRPDDPNGPPGSGFFFGEGTWIYLESNNREGLQSGGTAPYPENPLIYGEDPCANADPDMILF